MFVDASLPSFCQRWTYISLYFVENYETNNIINHKNAARDMRNSWKSFVFFWDFSKFANANFGEEGVKSLGSILHDRLTSFDLAKSGKFNIRCQNEFSQASLVPSTEGTDCFTIFVTPGIPEPC